MPAKLSLWNCLTIAIKVLGHPNFVVLFYGFSLLAVEKTVEIHTISVGKYYNNNKLLQYILFSGTDRCNQA